MLDEEETAPGNSTDQDVSPQANRPKRPRRSAKRPAGPAMSFSAASGVAKEPETAPTLPPKVEKSTAPGTGALLFQPPPIVPDVASSHDDAVERPPQDSDSEDRSPRRNQKQDAPKDKPKKSGGRQGNKGSSNRGNKNSGKNSDPDASESDVAEGKGDQESEEEGGGKRRRRRRRREDDGGQARKKSGGGSDEVTAVRGSTRLEAKRQRRREGRESGRRRAPVLSEAEFLARRESVERQMIVRQQGRLTQIAVLEDDVLVEHYVNKATATSQVGNVYVGRVQNVLPSMEAAFVDIGRGRNAVLYAGEVNWDAAGLEGQPKRIEQALSSGDEVLVQVTKDPVGHKGARLTSQISLPGRFVVLVPDGSVTGISRKLPVKERSRLRAVLKEVVPEGFGVIVRTAAEGASEEDLSRDVEVLHNSWNQLTDKSKSAKAPAALHSEPDLALRVVRDIFNSDFKTLIVSGEAIWEILNAYVADNAPGLSERVQHWTSSDDIFASHRIDEQLAKALDRKVYLPSGGSLVIDRTEAMTVVDVNTGRFVGQGGNLEETVTKNNLEAAEEVVRQLRLRDVGGIIVVDFIDMVLEDNRDLVIRRMVECLGRDRTRHQVAEVSSLGLVQMTRKRIGQGLMETFSEPCECCNGRGEKVQSMPVDHKQPERRRAARPPGAHDPAEVAARAANGADDVEDPDGSEADLDTQESIETGTDEGLSENGHLPRGSADEDSPVTMTSKSADLVVDDDVAGEQSEFDAGEQTP
jgi:ribonuclease E